MYNSSKVNELRLIGITASTVTNKSLSSIHTYTEYSIARPCSSMWCMEHISLHDGYASWEVVLDMCGRYILAPKGFCCVNGMGNTTLRHATRLCIWSLEFTVVRKKLYYVPICWSNNSHQLVHAKLRVFLSRKYSLVYFADSFFYCFGVNLAPMWYLEVQAYKHHRWNFKKIITHKVIFVAGW